MPMLQKIWWYWIQNCDFLYDDPEVLVGNDKTKFITC